MGAVPPKVGAMNEPREEPPEVGFGLERPWEYASEQPIEISPVPSPMIVEVDSLCPTLENIPLGFLADN